MVMLWGRCLGRETTGTVGRTGPCARRNGPSAVRSGGASAPEKGGEASTAELRCVPRRLFGRCGCDCGESRLGISSNTLLGWPSGALLRHTPPSPTRRTPAATLMCSCPTWRKTDVILISGCKSAGKVFDEMLG